VFAPVEGKTLNKTLALARLKLHIEKPENPTFPFFRWYVHQRIEYSKANAKLKKNVCLVNLA
jgi:hypothetical protein